MIDGLASVDLDFTGQPPIPDAGITRANELMRSGRLFRYGEAGAEELDVAKLEAAFATSVGSSYCVALNSCGASLAVALMAAGVEAGDPVLMNAFTLAPVPGSIAHVGARPVFVGITEDYLVDLDELAVAARASGARHLLLSHMRGHLADMPQLMATAEELGLTVIEDCAHTMGASWAGKPSGTFGAVGCFSTQTFKHINSGEGGLLVTDDEDIAARAVLLSGSYMLYAQHGAAPAPEVFERHRMTTPNFSMRMSALAAAVALPQLEVLPARAQAWNLRYGQLAGLLEADPSIRLPVRPPEEEFVASSIQFNVSNLSEQQMTAWIALAAEHGVFVKWFGRPEPVGFTSRFDHWKFASEQALARTSAILEGLCDLRIPLAMTDRQTQEIAAVIRGAVAAVR